MWIFLGEQELREATVDKAHYLAQIGDCDEAIKLFKTSEFKRLCIISLFFPVFQEDKKVPLGVKLDVTFSLLRIGLFYNNRKVLGFYLSLTETIRSVRTLSWRH